MKARRLAAAAAAAAVPLWPSVTGAAEAHDQQWQKSEDVVVYGDTCHIDAWLEYRADLSRAELGLFVGGEGNCDTVQTSIVADVRNLGGDQQSVSVHGAESLLLFVQQTARIDHAIFRVTFTNEECQPRDPGCEYDYFVSPK